MRVDPAIAGLRSALASQPCTNAALAAWRGSSQGAAMADELARWDGGAALAGVPALTQLLGDCAAAQAFAASMITPLLASLQAEPLAQLPLGHACAPGMTRLRLASHGRTALSLLAVARREQTMPVSALFEDGEVHEVILAGAGEALVHRLTSGRLARDRDAPRDLRWEALRHTLALDAGEGLAVLAAVAGDPADALSGAATALQNQLLASRPELAAVIKEPA